jgi:hypothetical protein
MTLPTRAVVVIVAALVLTACGGIGDGDVGDRRI